MKHCKTLMFILIALLSGLAYAEDSIEIHDAHIHYDEDMWKSLSAADALQLLKEQNIKRALVSSAPTEGAAILYAQDPEMVIPMLRPYDSWRHRYFWYKDPELKNYLLNQLKEVPYRGIGEFHVFGKNADTIQIEEMIQVAQEYKLPLHPHTDLEGMTILLKKAKGLVVMWAHGGGDVPEKYLLNFLEEYPGFYIELSLREGMLDENEELTAEWMSLLTKFHTRFLLGMDTYKPSRWADLPETAAETRHWLKQLPKEIAADIARNNLNRLFPENKNNQ